MNCSNVRISLDIHKTCSSVAVNAKKGDIGRRLHITLTDGGIPYRIGVDCAAVFTAEKPDGNVVYNACTIQGDTIIYDMTEQTTAVAGKADCEIKLYGGDGKLITSPGFILVVSDTVYDEGDEVESVSEFSALTAVMTEVADLKKNGLKGDKGDKGDPGEPGPPGPPGESDDFRICVYQQSELVADKTFAEIYEAHEAGQTVYCVYCGNNVLSLVQVTPAEMVFQKVIGTSYQRVTFKADGTIAYAGGSYATLGDLRSEWRVFISMQEDGAYTAGRSLADIVRANGMNYPVVCVLDDDNISLPLTHCGSEAVFSGIYEGYAYTATITADDVTVERSEVGGGSGGVYVGSEEPTDPNVNVWIDPEGDGTLIDLDPVAATEDMTQSVGVGPDGKLWTIPGGGSGGGSDCIMSPETAAVGQTIVVKAVDEAGKPTEWECVDFPKLELIATITTTEEVSVIEISTDANGEPFSLKDVGIRLDRTYTNMGETGLFIESYDAGGHCNRLAYIVQMHKVTQYLRKFYDGSFVVSMFGSAADGSSENGWQGFMCPSNHLISKIQLILSASAIVFPIGTKVELWGVKA